MLNVFELFSCSGGMAEGLRRAGLPVAVAVDRDPDACASYLANLGKAPLQIDAFELLALVRSGWAPASPIDLFVADPPCVPWSRAGKRLGRADERLQPWVSCRDALQHLASADLGQLVRVSTTSSAHPISRADEPSHVIPASMPGNGGRVVTWPWDRPSTVVCAGDTIAPFGRNGRDGSSQRGNPNAVKLSELAGAILQGFAESWVFAGASKRARWSQIGQAVPPAVAEAIGRSMLDQFAATARRAA